MWIILLILCMCGLAGCCTAPASVRGQTVTPFFHSASKDITPSVAVKLARNHIRAGLCGTNLVSQAEEVEVTSVDYESRAWGDGAIYVAFALSPKTRLQDGRERQPTLQVIISPNGTFISHEVSEVYFHTENRTQSQTPKPAESAIE